MEKISIGEWDAYKRDQHPRVVPAKTRLKPLRPRASDTSGIFLLLLLPSHSALIRTLLLPSSLTMVDPTEHDGHIDGDDVWWFRASLKWCALDQSSRASRTASYLAFLLFGLAVPLAISIYTHGGSGVDTYWVAQVSQSVIAGFAFFTLSVPGLRHLLHLDGLRDDVPTVRHSYAREHDRAYRNLAYILLPCFAVELAHKILFFFSTSVQVHIPFPPRKLPVALAMLVAVLAAWVYRTLVFLFVCLLFRLTCELQILRLEEVKKGLEQGIESDAWVIFREHSRIRKQLLVTSHRYRIFIIGCLVTISITQLGALIFVLSPKSHKNFFNFGHLVVCSVVQISGFLMCLIGATRMTHRAHGIVAIATEWHMRITGAASNALLLKSGSPAAAQTPPCPTSVNDNSDAQLATAAFQTREALGQLSSIDPLCSYNPFKF